MSAAARNMIVVPDPQRLAQAAAERLIARIGSQDRVAICLTGGSTPKRLYDLLAASPWREKIPWPRLHWFMTDDRFVPPDDPLSNIGMARRVFLDACAPQQHVHAIDTTAPTPGEAAMRYERDLRAFHAQGDAAAPLFDLVLMGVGPDGHTASVFPNAPALAERDRWAVGVSQANVAPFVPRVTLTLPCLALTREMLFLVSGRDKVDIMTHIVSGDDLPAAHARATQGDTVWLLDKAAAPQGIEGSHADGP